MTTQQLPERPNLEQLKRQAKDLLHATRENAPAVLLSSRVRFRALPSVKNISDAELLRLNFALHDAQSVIAREHGFSSWNALRERVEDLTLQFDAAAVSFTCAVVERRIERAERLLTLHPRIVSENLYAALVAGEVEAVQALLHKNPALVATPGGPQPWAPLLYVAHSGWADKNSAGLVATARLLLERGADPNTSYPWRGDPKAKLPALWAAACHARHHALAKVLLEAGANPDDGESVYHAAENGDIAMLDLLAQHGAHADGGAGSQPWGNTPLYFILGHFAGQAHDAAVRAGAQWLLVHGADPNRVCYPDKARETALHVAARHWDGAMLELLFAHGANPHARRGDGRNALTLAELNGRTSAAVVLRARGVADILTESEKFAAACLRGDAAEAGSLRRPEFVVEHAGLLSEATSHGNTTALEAMLNCGFDVHALGCMGETALHWAAFRGNAAAARVLVAHGARADVRDSQYHAEPLGWCDHAASCGEGGPGADFEGVARALLEAGSPLPTPEQFEKMGSDDVMAVVADFMRKQP